MWGPGTAFRDDTVFGGRSTAGVLASPQTTTLSPSPRERVLTLLQLLQHMI